MLHGGVSALCRGAGSCAGCPVACQAAGALPATAPGCQGCSSGQGPWGLQWHWVMAGLLGRRQLGVSIR